MKHVATKSPLEQVRRARTLTQADLARLADVEQASISRAERGLQHLATHVQIRIAAILGSSREELFPEEPPT